MSHHLNCITAVDLDCCLLRFPQRKNKRLIIFSDPSRSLKDKIRWTGFVLGGGGGGGGGGGYLEMPMMKCNYHAVLINGANVFFSVCCF